MDFILRIFFSGMITFVPSSDSKELTVVLTNTHGYAVSDGSSLPHHVPLLLARAESCTGDCDSRDLDVARFIYAEKSDAQAQDALEGALAGGGAWNIAGTELSVQKPTASEGCLHPPLRLQTNLRTSDSNGPRPIPLNGTEVPDFTWVPDLSQVVPALGAIKPAVTAANPPSSLVVSRLKLRNGKISTYSLVSVGGNVKPVHFKPLGTTTEAPYVQAVANWVVAEIRVPGDAVDIVAQQFADGSTRSMRLKPKNGQVEIAVLNIPSFTLPVEGEVSPPPDPGKHFEGFFELASTPPAARPVPHLSTAAGEPEIPWQTLDPNGIYKSEMLTRLRIDPGRGIYDRVLCPMALYP